MIHPRKTASSEAPRWRERALGMLGWALTAALFSVFALEARAEAPGTFAKVGDVVITHQEYDAAYARAARSKFYHGKPPEKEVAALQREVGKSLVDEVLLVKEAKRRGIKPDAKAVQKTIDEYDKQYGKSEQWQKSRDKMLPELKAKLEHDNVQEQLRTSV